MFVHSLSSCDQDLIKRKVKIIDFQTISNSIDYDCTIDYLRFKNYGKVCFAISALIKKEKASEF